MASLNQCNFIGNIGKIETRYMSDGTPVTNLSIACNESWKSKDGTKQERVEWVNIVMYRKLSEIAEKFLQKGNQIFVSGRMTARKWTDKNGQDRYTTEIIATDLKMLGSRDNSQNAGDGQSNSRQESNNAFSDMEDDIPF